VWPRQSFCFPEKLLPILGSPDLMQSVLLRGTP
jgi:hypothetical protein